LQLLDQEESIDMTAVGATAQRLFAARRSHSWPPVVVSYAGWEDIYREAAEGLSVIKHVDDAIVWTNEFIVQAATRQTAN
jgi:hypothetical protein